MFERFKRKKKVETVKKLLKEVAVQGRTDIWAELIGLTPYNPDDVGISVYKEMLKDAEVKVGYSLIKLGILSRDWKISYMDEKGDLEILEQIKYALEHFDGRLEGALAGLVSAIVYGFAISEVVLRIIEEGRFKGKVGIKRIKSLDPETIEFVVDKFGNLEKIIQKINEKDIPLSIEQMILYVNEKEFGNYYGTSRLRAVYKNYFVKKALITYWNIALERFGMPLLIGTVPNSGDLDKMIDILNNVQNKTSIAKTSSWEIEALETGVGRSAGGDYKNAIMYHNEQILKGLLVPPILINQPQTGSYALSETQFGLFQMMLKNLENDLSSLLEQYLIKPLVIYNYGEQERYPQFQFKPMTKEDLLSLSKVFALLVKNQIIGTDEGWMRDMMGVPHRDVAEVTRDTLKPKTSKEKAAIKPSQQVKTPKVEKEGWQG